MKYKFILFIPITAFIITSALAQDAVLPPTSRLELRKTGIVSITKDTSGKVRAIKLVVNHYDVKLDEYGKRLASMDGQEVSVNCSFSNEGGKRVVTVRDPQYQGEASGVSAQLLRKKGIISVTKNASGQVAAIRLIVNSYDIPLDEYSKQLATMDGRKVRATGSFSNEGGKRQFYVKSVEPVTAEGAAAAPAKPVEAAPAK